MSVKRKTFHISPSASAWVIARRIRHKPCASCGFYGCICQLGLSEFFKRPIKMLDSPCPNCHLYLCSCLDWELVQI